MSRTFHAKSQYPENHFLIERRKMRQSGEKYIFEEPAYADIRRVSQEVRQILKRIQENQKKTDTFIKNIGQLEDDYLESLYQGVPLEMFEGFKKEDAGVLSEYTARKVQDLTAFNPQLLREYLSQWNEPYALLEYHGPILSKPLTNKQEERMIQKMWGMLYMITPPSEFQRAAEITYESIARIKRQIDTVIMYINIALARPFDDIF